MATTFPLDGATCDLPFADHRRRSDVRAWTASTTSRHDRLHSLSLPTTRLAIARREVPFLAAVLAALALALMA